MTIRNILDILSAVAVLAFIACCVVAAVRQTKGYRKPWGLSGLAAEQASTPVLRVRVAHLRGRGQARSCDTRTP